MYNVIFTNQFKRDYKLCTKRKYEIHILDELLTSLSKYGTVSQENRPHLLSGKLQGLWECHVKPDWLLIWKKDENTKSISLIATGTHSDLF